MNADLTNCDKEPIHQPGAIQPHGVLLAFNAANFRIVQFSENAIELLRLRRDCSLTIHDLLESDTLASELADISASKTEGQLRFVPSVRVKGGGEGNWTAVLHRWRGTLFLELEAQNSATEQGSTAHGFLGRSVSSLDLCASPSDFLACVCQQYRTLTGFDRVMVYRFSPDGSGTVVAEDRAEELDSYLDLRFPATDIPAQARRLYLLNPYRLTADVEAAPVPLQAASGVSEGPLDLSFCALRATSPIHLEYLRNMGVRASLSFSIVHEEKLWGLIACHARDARLISQRVRVDGSVLARFVGLQVGFKEAAGLKSYADKLKRVRDALGSQAALQNCDFTESLMSQETHLLSAIDAKGVALRTTSRLACHGETPSAPDLHKLCEWCLRQPWEPVWSTDQLSSVYPPATSFQDKASGVLCLRLSPNSPECILWFRPEVVRTVHWAGDPNKPVESSATGAPVLHPRRSFALWKETVEGRSLPWEVTEIEHAVSLQKILVQSLLHHRSGEILRLNAELQRRNHELDQFAAIASHDMKEPLRTITTYTQLLTKRASGRSTEQQNEIQELADFIVEGTRRMHELVDSLLQFARAGRAADNLVLVPLQQALDLALKALQLQVQESGATVQVDQLPSVRGNLDELARVFQNLLSNALKFRKPDKRSIIHVRAMRTEHGSCIISITDNGIGFDPSYASRVFESFQRLHSRQFEGTGLGLAICYKIISALDGRIWADSRPGEGATFSFELDCS